MSLLYPSNMSLQSLTQRTAISLLVLAAYLLVICPCWSSAAIPSATAGSAGLASGHSSLGTTASAIALPSATRSDPQRDVAALSSAFRCQGVVSRWCHAYYHQPSVPWDELQLHGKPCPNNCSNVGVCHADTGLCDCPAGWKGRDCSKRDARPCTNSYRADKAGPPASHLNAVLRDTNWSAPGFTYSRCLGVCDDDTATCYCDGPVYGRIPPPPGSPPGTPPLKEGRLMVGACRRVLTDFQGQPLHWVTPHGGRAYDQIYGPRGWCMDPEPLRPCPCDVDGYDGPFCDIRTEYVCLNQCSGHGSCYRGFCRCHTGWYGLDCAKKAAWWKPYQPAPQPTPTAAAEPAAAAAQQGSTQAVAEGGAEGGASSGAAAAEGTAATSAAAAGAAVQPAAAEGAAATPAAAASGEQPQEQQALPEPYWSLQDLFRKRPWLRNVTVDPWESTQEQDQGWLSAAQLLVNQGILAAGDSADSQVPEVYAASSRLQWEAAQQPSSRRSGPGSSAVARQRLQQRLQRRKLQRHFWTGGGSRMPGSEPDFNTSLAGLPGSLSNWLAASDLSGVPGDVLSGAGEQQGQHVGTSVQFAELLLEQGVEGVPQGVRRRPLIYVYDMPSPFVSRLLQYRSNKGTCSWRMWTRSNWTQLIGEGWRYSMESHFHELLLQSPHRTLDPKQADFFYVPVYASCFMEAVAGFADHPWFFAPSDSHVKGGVLMYQAALEWVRATYPFWNATQGADHIWLFTHDEGACWAPKEIYSQGIILSHWGRTTPGGNPPGSMNSRASHDYNIEVGDDPAAPEGYRRYFVGHPCYTPGKDLVLPPFRPPQQYHASVYLAGDVRKRDILLLFRDDMGQGKPPSWSRGLRQEVYQLATQHNWQRQHSMLIGPPAALPGDYSLLMARSQFCLVVSGGGWSPGFTDALLHGCIPVVVEDDIQVPFSNLLQLQQVVVTVPRSQLKDLPQLLLGISEQRVQHMRRAIGSGLWRRMAWLTHPMVSYQAQTVLQANEAKYPWLVEQRQQELQRFVSSSSGGSSGGAGGEQGSGTTEAAGGGRRVALQAATAAGVSDDKSSGSSSASSGSSLPEQLMPPIWLPCEPEDDAFGTVMVWLHHLLQQRQHKAKAAQQHHRGPPKQQHTRHHHAEPQQQQQQQPVVQAAAVEKEGPGTGGHEQAAVEQP